MYWHYHSYLPCHIDRKNCNTIAILMKVLTIQSLDLELTGRVFADASRCNHEHALDVYKRLFADYNNLHQTSFKSFFWGFSDLLTDDFDMAVKRACEMIGTYQGKVLVLEVPDLICLETDFYNFSDEIFAHLYPEELESIWDSIYEKRNAEKQVIFPYIEGTKA